MFHLLPKDCLKFYKFVGMILLLNTLMVLIVNPGGTAKAKYTK